MVQASRKIENLPPDLQVITGAGATAVPAKTADYQAFQILRFAFTAVPLIAGIDKFTNVLANWEGYLSPLAPELLGIEPMRFMQIVGGIEIIAGIGVAVAPRIFAPIVGIWLLAIIVNLVFVGQYWDVAVRDFGLALCAFALGKLASYWNQHRTRLTIREERIPV